MAGHRRSRFFRNHIPRKQHLVRGKQGVAGEVTDLRDDMDGVLVQYEDEGNLVKNNPTATVNPGPNDDETQGYSILSFWLNVVSDSVFVCTDPTTGAAVWKETTLTFAGASIGSVKTQGDSSPPVPPHTTGDAYIVKSPGGGLWAGHDNEVATWNGVSWAFYVPQSGDRVWVDDETRNYIFNGTAWALPEDYLDHNILQNLAVGNVHTQYQLRSEENAANGYAGLDASGEVADAQHGSRSGAALHALVTVAINGFMSAVDKVKLNGIDTGATNTPLSDTDPVDVTKSAAQEGTATEASRQDHKHDVSTATPADVGSANAEGSASSLARSDHVHNHADQAGGTLHADATPSADGFMSAGDKGKLNGVEAGATNTPLASGNPVNVTKAAAAPGSDTSASRRDHKHDITTGAPSDVGAANAEGTGSALAREDHVHNHANQAGGTLHAVVIAAGAAGFMAGADKTKLDNSGVLTSTAPVDVTKAAAAVGTALESARQDHKHDISTAQPGAAQVGDSAAEGAATSLARSDHAHAVTAGTPVAVEASSQEGAASTFSRSDHIHAAVEISAFISAIIETIAITVTESADTVYLNLEKSGTGALTVLFSDGHYTFDCTPIAQVALTAGSDISPTLNFIYILQSTKALTVSTTGFPAAEHAPIATVLVQSAASVASNGAYKVHAWTDHLLKVGNNGHIAHLNAWIRQQHATWVSGVGQTLTITPGSPDTVIFTPAAGLVQQLHEHTFPAFTGTPDLYVVNDSVTPYNIVTDLSALLTDSTGATMSGMYFSLVIWGVVSESTGDCKLFVNLPGGSYSTSSAVISDDSKYANYSIPAEFKGTGFLISELKLRHQVSGGGTWTSIQEVDLRGLLPSLSAGAGSAASSEFADNAFRIQDDGDPTKEIAFQASGITTATTRTVSMPDKDIKLKVFGEDEQREESLGESTTTSATPQAKVQLVTGALTGTYRIGYGAKVNNNDKVGEARLYNVTDASQFGDVHQSRVKDSTENYPTISGAYEIVLAGVSKTIELQYYDVAGGQTQKIKDAFVEFWRVD